MEVRMVDGAAEAFAVLRGAGEGDAVTRPDLVLLDHTFSRRDGQEFLRGVGADPALREIPVVILASSRADADAAREETPGAAAYAVEPLEFKQLAQIVQSLPGLWITILTVRPDVAPPEPLLLV